jgi:hypothetical protein
MTTLDEADPVGQGDIAGRFGCSVKTVEAWRRRPSTKPRFPTPTWWIAAGPVWHWPVVARWATKSGRTPLSEELWPTQGPRVVKVSEGEGPPVGYEWVEP